MKAGALSFDCWAGGHWAEAEAQAEQAGQEHADVSSLFLSQNDPSFSAVLSFQAPRLHCQSLSHYFLKRNQSFWTLPL